jgi:hypothetical protein
MEEQRDGARSSATAMPHALFNLALVFVEVAERVVDLGQGERPIVVLHDLRR